MTENELVSFIKKCQRENSDSGILLPDKNTIKIALNLLVNTSNNDIKILLLFDDNGKNSPLFDLIDNDVFINNSISLLKDENINFQIASNKVKSIRKSKFFKSLSENFNINNRCKVRAINDYIISEMKMKKLTNEFVLTNSNTLLFGDFSLGMDFKPYLNFNEKSFSKTLNSFFDMALEFNKENELER